MKRHPQSWNCLHRSFRIPPKSRIRWGCNLHHRCNLLLFAIWSCGKTSKIISTNCRTQKHWTRNFCWIHDVPLYIEIPKLTSNVVETEGYTVRVEVNEAQSLQNTNLNCSWLRKNFSLKNFQIVIKNIPPILRYDNKRLSIPKHTDQIHKDLRRTKFFQQSTHGYNNKELFLSHFAKCYHDPRTMIHGPWILFRNYIRRYRKFTNNMHNNIHIEIDVLILT